LATHIECLNSSYFGDRFSLEELVRELGAVRLPYDASRPTDRAADKLSIGIEPENREDLGNTTSVLLRADEVIE
jgi:hypothetical protein